MPRFSSPASKMLRINSDGTDLPVPRSASKVVHYLGARIDSGCHAASTLRIQVAFESAIPGAIAASPEPNALIV